VTKQALAEEGDERLAELSVHLATKNVEVVGRSGAEDDLHVAVLVLAVELLGRWEDAWVLVTELEETLHTAGTVLWTLTIVSVREVHDKTRSLQPLDFSRGNKLIDDTLCVVGKVTKLCLPDDKCVGRGQGVTILKAENTKLAQAGVGDDKL
jgi:hypothetical protein